MQATLKLLFLLVLFQLSACAVMNKQQCLNADWRQVGFDVAAIENMEKTDAFESRKRACAKHNTTANWKQFEAGYVDGIVEFCQLNNVVNAGVKGKTNVIKNNLCPEKYYPGFQDAFNTGYKLHILNTRVSQSNTDISHAYNQIGHYKNRIKTIRHQLNSNKLDNDERKRLSYERKKIRNNISYLNHDLNLYQQKLHHDVIERNRFADFLYNDYLKSLDDAYVSPNIKSGHFIKTFEPTPNN